MRKVIISLQVVTRTCGFEVTTAKEVLTSPDLVTVLNEHGDITIGTGRGAVAYMAREVKSVTYIN